jgi:hypothetical protein
LIAFADGRSWRCDGIDLITTDEALGEIDLDYARALAQRAAKAKPECLSENKLNPVNHL